MKPPIGLMPKWLHDELSFDDTSNQRRVNEINAAIDRYNAVSKIVPVDWIKEKTDIIKANELV